jgi:hypothetical protein
VKWKKCVPGGIRTPNLLIRSQLLYPVELQTPEIVDSQFPIVDPIVDVRLTILQLAIGN